jgi:hypothetical protein
MTTSSSTTNRDGRIGAVEQFELEHLDAARARFEDLSQVA